jgi:hypothetical protein
VRRPSIPTALLASLSLVTTIHDQFDVTIREFDVTIREFDVTIREFDVTIREFDVTIKEFDFTVSLLRRLPRLQPRSQRAGHPRHGHRPSKAWPPSPAAPSGEFRRSPTPRSITLMRLCSTRQDQGAGAHYSRGRHRRLGFVGARRQSVPTDTSITSLRDAASREEQVRHCSYLAAAERIREKQVSAMKTGRFCRSRILLRF